MSGSVFRTNLDFKLAGLIMIFFAVSAYATGEKEPGVAEWQAEFCESFWGVHSVTETKAFGSPTRAKECMSKNTFKEIEDLNRSYNKRCYQEGIEGKKNFDVCGTYSNQVKNKISAFQLGKAFASAQCKCGQADQKKPEADR